MTTECKNCGGTDKYKDGKCKNCVKLRVIRYQRANKEKVAKWRKSFKLKHKEKIKEDWIKYYEKNKDKISTYHSARREIPGVRDKLRKYKAEWKSLNQDKVAIQQHNRRAKIRNVCGQLSKNIKEILFEKQNGLCVYCGADLTKVTVHIDHIMPIALQGTNTDDNVQLTCAKCNYKKHAKHPDTFSEFIKRSS